MHLQMARKVGWVLPSVPKANLTRNLLACPASPGAGMTGRQTSLRFTDLARQKIAAGVMEMLGMDA